VANIFFPDTSKPSNGVSTENGQPSPATVGNFLNVNVTSAGSASMLLSAFSMAAADRNVPSGFKMGGGFSMPATPTSPDSPKNMELVGGPMDLGGDKPLEKSRKASAEDDMDQKMDNSMLRRILTMKEDGGTPGNSKAESPSPGSTPRVASPVLGFDGNTQATLIEKSENLRLGSDAQDEDMNPEFWTTFINDPDHEVVPSKVHRGMHDLDTSSKQTSLPSVEKLFDAGGAAASSAFVFTKFGTDEAHGIRPFGLVSEASPAASTVSESG
jgi:hypothetical protein